MNKFTSLAALVLAPLAALHAAETNGVAIEATAPGTVISPLLTLKLAGDWRIIVTANANQSRVNATLDVAPPEVIVVTAEKHDKLRDFNPNVFGWDKGSLLNEIRACETAAKGALDPASLVVRDGTEATATPFDKGKDFDADLEWGAVGRLPAGRIQADQQVFISYKYAKRRIDSVVLGTDRKITIKPGEPQVAMCKPPELAAGESRLANIFIAGMISALTPDNLFPILEIAYPEPPKPVQSIAEARLPKTMKKLQSGEPLRILAWGDSVTGYQRWQKMFVARLQAKYPKAQIELITEAWPAHNSANYLAEPTGSEQNYQEKVLNRKPDLIISEFVNDAGLTPAEVDEQYGKLLADFQKIGVEWTILTPHYVLTELMPGFTKQRDIDNDPRPYVAGLRTFAEKNHVALADASLRYGRLWRQGIPYLTLMENNVNHPNEYGHSLFSDSLIALFR